MITVLDRVYNWMWENRYTYKWYKDEVAVNPFKNGGKADPYDR